MIPRTLQPHPTRRIDLAATWRAERRRARQPSFAHEPSCTGHGWLLRTGLVDVLSPLLQAEEFGDPSFSRFASLGAGAAARLLELLDEDYLADGRQNDGPTIGSVLRAVVAHPDRLRAHGYVIGPGRCDERIAVEGVLFRSDRDYRLCPGYGPQLAQCECEPLYARLREELGVDDAISPPDELDRWYGYGWGWSGYPVECWYRAWWD